MIDEETILSLNLKAAWELYTIKFEEMKETIIDGEPVTTEEEMSTARDGKYMDFDIEHCWKNKFREKPKDKAIVIFGEVFKKKDFNREMEERTKIIKGALLRFYGDDKDPLRFARPKERK